MGTRDVGGAAVPPPPRPPLPSPRLGSRPQALFPSCWPCSWGPMPRTLLPGPAPGLRSWVLAPLPTHWPYAQNPASSPLLLALCPPPAFAPLPHPVSPPHPIPVLETWLRRWGGVWTRVRGLASTPPLLKGFQHHCSNPCWVGAQYPAS